MTTFDYSQCTWEKLEQVDCANSTTQTTYLVQSTSTSIASSFTSSTTSPSPVIFTESVLEKSEIEQSNSAMSILKPLVCDPEGLDTTWNCSNAFNQHSLCIKTDVFGNKQLKRCTCRNNFCSWKQKNHESRLLESNSFQSNLSSTLKGEKTNLYSDSLASIIEQLHFVNKGEINVKFELV